MKNLTILFLMAILMSCSETNTTNTTATTTTKTPSPENSLDWLMGNWKRVNDEEGKTTFEYWEKKSENEYLGLGYTLADKDTVFKGDMKIFKIKEAWNLEVIEMDGIPVVFEFSNQSANSFICENEANEFPKKIIYSFDGSQLEAKVSAEDFEIPFYFKKAI